MKKLPFIILLLLFLGLTLYSGSALAKQLVRIKVYPEHVGVFYNIKTQQFQAIAVFDDGSQADYTEKVGWSLKANPFPRQELRPGEVAKINQKGLLTVLNSWGRVNVVATFPPPAQTPKFSPLTLNTLLLAMPRLNVTPATGPLAGENSVTVSSDKVICLNDSDLRNVSLAGVYASGLNCLDAGHKVVATARSADSSGTGDVVINSSAFGRSIKTNGYTYNPPPFIRSVLPASGPLAGGNTVTIKGRIGGGGNDISYVRFDGKRASIISQKAGEVVVTVPPGNAGGDVRVAFDSILYGTAVKFDAYKYTGVITNVSPSSGPLDGGNMVLIDGLYLCGGAASCELSDIARVTLKGEDAIVENATQNSIVVTAGPAAIAGTGAVVVYSNTYGVIRSEADNLYTYSPAVNTPSVTSGGDAMHRRTEVFPQGENLHNDAAAEIE